MKNHKLNFTLINSIIFFLFISISMGVQAQSGDRQIMIGEKVPDISIKEIINYKSSSAKPKLSDFKGKLIILDFWATYCAPCVGMFPKTDSLKRIFKGQVEFLPITKEPKARVEKFLNHLASICGFKPMSVVNDNSFSNLFIYNGIPYYVWIDANGKVLATTGSDEITQKNISAVLSGQPVAFENRRDIRNIKIDIVHSPLFLINDNYEMKDSTLKRPEIPLDNIYSYSIATKYIENSNGGLMFDTTRFAAYNVSVDHLYRWFYNVGYYGAPVFNAFDPPPNYRFDINDPKLLAEITVPKTIRPGSKEMLDWSRANAVSYEIIYPKGIDWKKKMKLVKEDLDRYFAKRMGFDTHVEKITDTNTLVLRIFDKGRLKASKDLHGQEHDDRYSYSQRGYPAFWLVRTLNGKYFHSQRIAIVDKTGLNENIDLNLNCDLTNINSMNEALKKYGLIFQRESSQIDELIFSEIKH